MTIHKTGTRDCQPFCRPTGLQFMPPPMSHRILPCWDGKFFFPVPSLLSHLMMPQYQQYMLLTFVRLFEMHTTASEPHFRHQPELKRLISTNVLNSNTLQLVNSSGCIGLSLVFGRPIVSSLNCGLSVSSRPRRTIRPWEILVFHSPLVVQVRHTTTRKRQTVHVDRLVPCVSQQNTDMSSGNQAAPVPHPGEHQNTQYFDNTVPPVPSDTSLSVSSRPRRTIRPPLRYRS